MLFNFFNSSVGAKQAYLQSLLKRLELLAPKTNNAIVKNLHILHDQFVERTFPAASLPLLIRTAILAERLIHNLETAKMAVDYTVNKIKMNATNNPYLPAKTSQLEARRERLNEIDLLASFNTLQRRRSLFSNPSYQEFQQTAYRKGTGLNMAMWYRDAHSKKYSEILGNCTEQANIAFVYLYTHVRECISEGKPSPVERLERVDVTNKIGGHSYVLMDKNPDDFFRTTKEYPIEFFLTKLDGFGDTCVVVEPWNRETPFYPASDIPQNMPDCGLTGMVNFEFGLDFKSSSESFKSISCRL